MTVGYMSGAKRAKNVPSITNNTCILGGPKKSGLVNMQGRNPNLSNAITFRAPYCGCGIPLGCIPGLAYLKANNLMTMNPQCSGGVPHRMYRGCRSSPATSYITEVPLSLSTIATEGPANTWTLNGSTTIDNLKTLLIPSGNTLIIPAGLTLTINGTVVNNGTITNNGTIINNNNTIINNVGANIIINSGSVFTNLGTVTNNGTIQRIYGSNINNTGTIGPNPVINTLPLSSIATNTGSNLWTLNGDTTIPTSYTLTIPSGNTLNTMIFNITLSVNSYLANNGTISLRGAMDIKGTFTNNGTTIFVNTNASASTDVNSSLINKGTITINGGTLFIGANTNCNNYSGATITINGGNSYFNNYANVINNGTIQNNGGIVQNYGTIGPNPVV